MKIIGLDSHSTSQPTSLPPCEMHYDDKIRFGGWNRKDYRFIRAKLKRFWHGEFQEETLQEQVNGKVPNLRQSAPVVRRQKHQV